jgi:pyrimidine deaminase RibD-like protein
MSIRITYKNRLRDGYHGRHGRGVCAGIVLERSYRDRNNRVCIMPCNTRGLHRSCYIEIHREDVNELVKALIDITMMWEGGDANGKGQG